jgi:hypothetical protein
MERLNLTKIKGEIKEQYQVTITNNFAPLGNLKEDNGDISRA